MIKINPLIVKQIRAASTLEALFPLFQNAIELEHATIPPYLTALFSIKPGTETETRSIIHSIVIEEMLHMTISSNILNAIGGHPKINYNKFVPEYPGNLPMGIASGLVVGLEPYSPQLAHDVFMVIEEPENPLPLKGLEVTAEEPEFRTIGEFYMALQEALEVLAPEILPGPRAYQVTSNFYPPDQLYPIITKTDAINAINIIIEQGEGTTTSPVDAEGQIAHYYRFEELYRGCKLVADSSAPYGYSYTGAPIPFDAANVWPLFPNTKAAMLAPGSEERRALDEFNQTYKNLLNGLHTTFNGQPDFLNNTIGLMFDLRLAMQKLGAIPFPGKTGFTIGPSFEFIPD